MRLRDWLAAYPVTVNSPGAVGALKAVLPGLHHPRFDGNDDAPGIGVEAFCRVAPGMTDGHGRQSRIDQRHGAV